ncbi:MAG: VWA domain-containing protein [Leptospirales bacterium]|nr:VWA domain-containing protein [Leptospirales bacterium]
MLYKKWKIYKILLLLMVGFILVCKPESSEADDVDPILDPNVNNDIILVLDTSYSMVGKPGKDIFDQVKSSIYWFIDNRVKDGDRIYFMTFDQEIKAFPEVIVDTKNDRDIVKKFISVIEAKGQWTYTFKMLSNVFALADKLTQEAEESKSKSKRKVAIFIMSDGLDDPPPDNLRDKIKLEDVTEKYQGRGDDWWIYISSFQDLQRSQKISDSYVKFKDELAKVSENVRIVEDADPEKAIESVIREEKKSSSSSFGETFKKVILPIILLMLLLLAIILLVKFIKKLFSREIAGRVEYWNHELLRPDVYTAKLGDYHKKELLLGRTPDCTIKLKEYESRYPIKLKAVKKSGQIILKITTSGNLEVGFPNREADGYVLDGDVFSASNITFKYIVD